MILSKQMLFSTLDKMQIYEHECINKLSTCGKSKVFPSEVRRGVVWGQISLLVSPKFT